MTDSTGMTGIADEGVEDSSFGEFVFAETLGQLCIDCPTGAGGEAGGEVAESHTSSAFPACATAGVGAGAGVGVGVDADRCSDGVISDGATVGAVDEGAVDSDEEFGDFTSAAEALRRASLTRPTAPSAPSAPSASSAPSAPSAEKDAGALDTDVFDASCATFTGTDAYFEEGRIAAQQSQPVKSRGAAGGTGTGGGTVCSINDLNSRSKSAADIPGLEAIDLHRVVIAQAQQQVVVKAGNAFMMRMKGFPKKLSKKQVRADASMRYAIVVLLLGPHCLNLFCSTFLLLRIYSLRRAYITPHHNWLWLAQLVHGSNRTGVVSANPRGAFNP